MGKKGERLDNKKVRNWAINLPPKKGEKLGKKGEKLDNGLHVFRNWVCVLHILWFRTCDLHTHGNLESIQKTQSFLRYIH